MKLFDRYNRINLVATIIVFLLSGLSFYFLLQYIVIGQVDEDLKIEQHEIQTYAAKYRQLPEIIPVRDQHTTYQPLQKEAGKRVFVTIHAVDQDETRTELFRELTFGILVNGHWYEVKVSKSLERTDNMIRSIATITLITILISLIVSVLINRLVLRKLWKPFYQTLESIRGFELGKNKLPVFSATPIEEFMLMNDTLASATAKADQDYLYLKEFTENASHELQTPLAIIQSKMDVLIQDEHLSEPQSRAVQSAYDAIQRMSKLNQGLLLLTKIENGQYREVAPLQLADKIKAKLFQLEEMIASRNIHITVSLDEKSTISMNTVLADILLNNLFTNAIRYTPEAGIIDIVLEKGRLAISNSAQNGPLDESRLFRRFGSMGNSGDGVGLGLAIIKEAAAICNLSAGYRYQQQTHQFFLSEKQ